MAGKSSAKGRDKAAPIIRKTEIVEAGHHGGAWKVAYADFVTAMMAFFLLMWLLNATTEDQRKGLADYFAPSNLMSHASSGTGLPFGGRTPFAKGEMVSDLGTQAVVQGLSQADQAPDDPTADKGTQRVAGGRTARPPGGEGIEDGTTRVHRDQSPRSAPGQPAGTATAPARTQSQALGQAQALANAGDGSKTPAPGAKAGLGAPDAAALRAEAARQEQAAFRQAEAQIRDAVHADPGLADIADQLAIDQTRDGLRIQLLDADKRPMFANGSATPLEHAGRLLRKIAPVLAGLPEGIAIAGHTDATPFKNGTRGNWELSADRANATRRLLEEAGVPAARFRSVTGNADRDPLLPADPFAAANRRIAITVLRGTGAAR